MRRSLLIVLAAFIVCLSGCARQELVFSIDPDEVASVFMHVWYVYGEDGDIIMLADPEGIGQAVGTLNKLRSRSDQEVTVPRSLDSLNTLRLSYAAGGETVLYFETHSNGTPDSIYVENPSGGYTRYETSPGYFQKLIYMPSSPVPTDNPEHPGPTAQPKGT